MTKHLGISAFLTFLLAATFACACFSPTDHFAAEVLLNKPGVGYDLRLLEEADQVGFQDEAWIYRSHFEPDVAVILSEERGIELDDQEGLIGGLSVRLQIPTKTVEGEAGPDLDEAVALDKDTFDFAAAMQTELAWLRDHQIVLGLTDADIEAIAAVTKVQLAGWNSRLVYDGQWTAYFNSDGPLLLRDGGGCGGFDMGAMPEEILILGNTPTSVEPFEKAILTWARLKAE